jgi:hypothetical protein
MDFFMASRSDWSAWLAVKQDCPHREQRPRQPGQAGMRQNRIQGPDLPTTRH